MAERREPADLERLSDEEVAALATAVAAGEVPPDRFRSVALTAHQALVVADAVRDTPQRDGAIVVGRIVPDRPRGELPGRRFFDPVVPASRPDIVLRQELADGVEQFEVLTHLGYWDDAVGGVIVPGEQTLFRTDLTSVPSLFTWLVPRTGHHLPAALIHDGLVIGPGEPRSYVGPEVSREEADRILRDGMGELGSGLVRRWLVWAAVSLATMASDPRPAARWWWRVMIGATVGLIAVLGVLATVDLFDCRELLWWMGDRPAVVELVFGGMAATAIPALWSVLWGRRWGVGMILGISLALLLHVTLALLVVYNAYAALEALVGRKWGAAARAIAVAFAVAGGAIAVGWWACGAPM